MFLCQRTRPNHNCFCVFEGFFFKSTTNKVTLMPFITGDKVAQYSNITRKLHYGAPPTQFSYQNLFHSFKFSPKLLMCQWVIHQWKTFQHKASDIFSLITYFHLDSLTLSDQGKLLSHSMHLEREKTPLSRLLWMLCMHLSRDWGYRSVEGLSWGEDVLVVLQLYRGPLSRQRTGMEKIKEVGLWFMGLIG